MLGDSTEQPGRRVDIRIPGLALALMVFAGAAFLVTRPDGEPTAAVAAGAGTSSDAEGERREPDGTTSSTSSTLDATASTLSPPEPAPPSTDPAGDAAIDLDLPTSPSSTTTTTNVCSNSFDPACGPFRWNQPLRPAQPMTASIELLTSHPVAGEPIYFRLRAADPDAATITGSVWTLTPPGHDEHLTASNCYPSGGADEGFGPWTPPTSGAGTFDDTTWKRAPEPGTYWAIACFSSTAWDLDGTSNNTSCPGDGRLPRINGWVCHDPYGDFLVIHTEVVVSAS